MKSLHSHRSALPKTLLQPGKAPLLRVGKRIITTFTNAWRSTRPSGATALARTDEDDEGMHKKTDRGEHRMRAV